MRTPVVLRLTSVLALLLLPLGAARAESVLRVGMTLADIPVMNSQPDQGGEGWRFVMK